MASTLKETQAGLEQAERYLTAAIRELNMARPGHPDPQSAELSEQITKLAQDAAIVRDHVKATTLTNFYWAGAPRG